MDDESRRLRAQARETAPPRHAWTVVPSGREAPVKGGKTRDIPLPAVVTQFLQRHVDWVVATKVGTLTQCRRVLMLPILLRCVAAKCKMQSAKCKLTMRPSSSFAQRRE
jgi:hypothetical protein